MHSTYLRSSKYFLTFFHSICSSNQLIRAIAYFIVPVQLFGSLRFEASLLEQSMVQPESESISAINSLKLRTFLCFLLSLSRFLETDSNSFKRNFYNFNIKLLNLVQCIFVIVVLTSTYLHCLPHSMLLGVYLQISAHFRFYSTV